MKLSVILAKSGISEICLQGDCPDRLYVGFYQRSSFEQSFFWTLNSQSARQFYSAGEKALNGSQATYVGEKVDWLDGQLKIDFSLEEEGMVLDIVGRTTDNEDFIVKAVLSPDNFRELLDQLNGHFKFYDLDLIDHNSPS